MYIDLSPTHPQCIAFITAINREMTTNSQDRPKAIAMGIALAFAKNCKKLHSETPDDVMNNYRSNFQEEFYSNAGAINELFPIDTNATLLYALKFYQLINSAAHQPMNAFIAATAPSVEHAVLGTATYFSQDDIAFMQANQKVILNIAVAVTGVIAQ